MSNNDEKFHFYGHKTFVNHKGNEEQRRVSITGILHENNVVHIGIAACSLADQFRKKKGRGISTHRAQKNPSYNITLIPFTEGNEDSYPRKQFIAWCNDYCDKMIVEY